VPFSSRILGKYLGLIQPPLPAGENPEEVATEDWASMIPEMKGKTRLVSVTPELEGERYGDGIGFPAVTPWSVGVFMEDLELDFGVANPNNPLTA